MPTIPKSVRYAGVALVGAVALGACSPAPGSGSTGTGTPPTTAPPVTVPVSTAIGGTYAVRYATDSTATIRVSGDTLTVTAGAGFRVEGASCTLPVNAVLAVLSGSGNHFTGTHWGFNTGNCASGSAYASTADLNADGSVTLTGPTGTHLFTKTGNTPALAVDLPATYDVTYATAGRATAHVSGSVVSISVTSPIRVEGASCDLPTKRILAVFDGTGIHRSGTHWGFNTGDCTPGSAYSSKLYVNSDQSLTVTGPSGPHLFLRRASVATQSSVDPVGTYDVHYGTAGTAVVHRAGAGYTISVGSGFAVEGASCSLASTTVLGSYTGTGTTLNGTHFGFNSGTCTQGPAYSSKVHVNSDRTLTVTGPTGPHLFERD